MRSTAVPPIGNCGGLFTFSSTITHHSAVLHLSVSFFAVSSTRVCSVPIAVFLFLFLPFGSIVCVPSELPSCGSVFLSRLLSPSILRPSLVSSSVLRPHRHSKYISPDTATYAAVSVSRIFLIVISPRITAGTPLSATLSSSHSFSLRNHHVFVSFSAKFIASLQPAFQPFCRHLRSFLLFVAFVFCFFPLQFWRFSFSARQRCRLLASGVPVVIVCYALTR